jgi:hypothetical protein
MSWRALAALLIAALGCTSQHAGDGLRGRVTFELDNTAGCGGAAGPSPAASCSRITYTGGLQATGDTAVQRFTPLDANGLIAIDEIEVLRLEGGELRSQVNAVYHSKAAGGPYVSLHTIVSGTGRYEGATGTIQLWGLSGQPGEYLARIQLAR